MKVFQPNIDSRPVPASGGRYSIAWVSRQTGLSAHLIRIWEKRYGLVRPERSATRRRYYSEAELKKLRQLAILRERGMSIGALARLAPAELEAMAQRDLGAETGEALLSRALGEVAALDGDAFERSLKLALGAHGPDLFLEDFVAPILERIGTLWRSGELGVAHEHLASALIRSALGEMSRAYPTVGAVPVALLGTTPGQIHELGALLAVQSLARLGWRPLYLGAQLPFDDWLSAARQSRARLVALSFVHPALSPECVERLARFKRRLPPGCDLVCGGRAALEAQTLLKKRRIPVFSTLGDFKAWLKVL